MASDWQARLLLPDAQYLRVDDELAEKVALDDVGRCKKLQERGRQKARFNYELVRTLLLDVS